MSRSSLEIDFVFTNISLDEITDICINQLVKNTDTVKGLKKPGLKQMFFKFNGFIFYFFTQRGCKKLSIAYLNKPIKTDVMIHLQHMVNIINNPNMCRTKKVKYEM